MLTADGKAEQPKLEGGGDPIAAFATEIQTAVDGVASGKEPDLLSGQLRATPWCCVTRRSNRYGRERRWLSAEPGLCGRLHSAGGTQRQLPAVGFP